MKTIGATTKRISLIIGLLMAALILLVFNSQAASSPDPELDLRFRTEVSKIDNAAKQYKTYTALHKDYESTDKVFKFYDSDEKLVYEITIPEDRVENNTKLTSYLHQSDLMMELDKTSFYRYSK